MTKRNQKNYRGFTYETEIIQVDRDIAQKLVNEYNLNVKFARYHVDGEWYSMVNKFPVAFFDLYGYVIINSEHELRCEMDVRKKIHKSNGIHSLPGYKKFSHVPRSIENYQKQINDNILKKEQESKIRNERLLRLQNIMKKCCSESKIQC